MSTTQFSEKTTKFIEEQSKESDAFQKIYFYDEAHENVPANLDADLFFEKRLTKVKGIVKKYPGRVLFLLSYTCAAHCRYCERQDRVGVGLDAEGRLEEAEIHAACDFIKNDSSITEVIFSGGDPLTNPNGFKLACSILSKIDHVRILRVHTRLPMQIPSKTNLPLLSEIKRDTADKIFYFSLHIDHPDELTPQTISVINSIRELGYIMLCQSVFLKGVNDDVDTLAKLFSELSFLGVRPYYLYHCHAIPTTKHFVMDIEVEVEIMSRLREQLSGVAFPQHVIELQQTTGKIIAPTDHWNTDLTKIRDFLGNEYKISERVMTVLAAPTTEDFERGTLFSESGETE